MASSRRGVRLEGRRAIVLHLGRSEGHQQSPVILGQRGSGHLHHPSRLRLKGHGPILVLWGQRPPHLVVALIVVVRLDEFHTAAPVPVLTDETADAQGRQPTDMDASLRPAAA